MTRRFALPALILFFAILASAIDRAHYRELARQARKSSEQKDWAGLKQTLIEIGRELPADTPRQMLTMASVETHLGNNAEALRWLQKYAATGLTYDVAADDDLAPLTKNPALGAIAEQFVEKSKTIDKAELVCTLPTADIMPEDLTYERSSKMFFTSSVQHHSLYRVPLPKAGGKKCVAAEIPLPGEAKRWPTLAVSWDARRNVLWMSTSAMPGFTRFPKEDEGKAALLAVDWTSGKILRRLDLLSDSPAVLGDMSIGRDGALYITDSIGGGIYRVPSGPLSQAKLEKIAEGLFSPQTPVVTADGKRLLVADYTIGIATMELPAAGSTALAKVGYLKHPDSIAVTGIDGLAIDGGTLIGIQNGTEPERILRFRLNKDQTEITSAEVLEQKTERLGEATHVVRVDGWYYVIANVGWDKIKDNGELKPGKQFTEPVLLRFRAH